MVVVLGHTKCGAIKGACQGVQMGHLTGLLEKIQSVIGQEQNGKENIPTQDPTFVEHVARMNIKYVMNEIPQRSKVIADMLEKGEIAIIGGLYDVETGRVHFFEHDIISSPDITTRLQES